MGGGYVMREGGRGEGGREFKFPGSSYPPESINIETRITHHT